MNINQRLRAAFDEFAASPDEDKPSALTLSRKWRVHHQLIQGALSLQQLIRLTERVELEPELGVVQPARGGARREAAQVLPDQVPKVKALLRAIGFTATCQELGLDWRQIQRVRSGNRALTLAHRIRLEQLLTAQGIVWDGDVAQPTKEG